MTKRNPWTVRIDPEVREEFTKFVVRTEGQKRGEISQHVENALSEYVDHDRASRIEERQRSMDEKLDTLLNAVSETDDTHTHTGPTTVLETVGLIVTDLQSLDRIVIREETIEDAIRERAGSDDRTLRQYKRELKREGECWENPHDESAVWTIDRAQWAQWAEDYINAIPDADVHDVTDGYPVDTDGFFQLAGVGQ